MRKLEKVIGATTEKGGRESWNGFLIEDKRVVIEKVQLGKHNGLPNC